MCILQSHKMWTFEVCHLELIVYIIHFLCGMFSQTSSNFLFVILWLLFAWACLVWFFSNMHFHILFEKPFVPFILTMALPVGSNSWNYQPTFFQIKNHIPYLLCFISYLLPYALSCEDDLGYLYSPGKYFLILIVLGQLIFTCGRIFLFVFILALALNCLIYCLLCLLQGS